MPFRADHPQHRDGQSFAEHQEEMARWMGYADARAMSRDHDPLHEAIAFHLGVVSHAMRDAAGMQLSDEEARLASLEENAILHLQKWMKMAGASVPFVANKP